MIEKENHFRQRIAGIGNYNDDLHDLIHSISSAADIPAFSLKTPYYQQALSGYLQRWNESRTKYLKVQKDFDRNHYLHEQRVIADAEFENFTFQFNNVKHELEILKQNQLKEWQTELRNYEKEVADYRTQLVQLEKEKENLTIKAPISGTLQNHKGIYSGSLVFVNQDLAQISPDTNLVAEVFVTPRDIGLLRNNMSVRFHVDAFNYNQWGMVSGRIGEIPNDVQIINDKPVFKVKCSLDKDHLALKNGYKGYLKKGMTLQARFMITERSLWQLLYDKVDDWVNPNIHKTTM
jgi:HlyD family secretion protein